MIRRLSVWTPGLAARVAERLFLTPIRHRQPERERAWARDAERLELRSPTGGRLQAWSWGEGARTALLVHGWAGRGLQLGAFAQPLVAAGFRVVAFDAPAHGRSTGRSTNLPEVAAAVGAVAREVGGVEALVAHSFGSVAALVALSQGWIEPTRVVLVASPSTLSGILAQFSEMTGFTGDVLQRMAARLSRRLGFSWADLEPLRLASGARVPALVIHDRRDDSVPFSEGEALTAAWPGSRLFATEGLGHFRVLRDPGVVGTAVDFARADAAADGATGSTVASFDTAAVPISLSAPSSTAARSWLLPALDRLDFRLDEREIAGELAFGRD